MNDKGSYLLLLLLYVSMALLPACGGSGASAGIEGSGVPPVKFRPTDSMGTPRDGHTATLLGDGTVLVVGGGAVGQGLATAELFDPVSQTFASTGSMETARYGNTATLLNDGTVLIAGGGASGGYLATAEVFDPTSGTFTSTGNMGMARVWHTATLLDDGMVLIAGGYDGVSLASAEIYDPATHKFSPAADMTTERYRQVAMLLNDGTVLIVGGLDNTTTNERLASAEVFHPADGTFTSTGSMSIGRNGHTATLLTDGTVLIAGGTDGTSDLAEAEVFDPANGMFTPTGNMATARFAHTATLVGDGPNTTVLVLGGFDAGVPLQTAEVWHPASGTFSPSNGLVTARGEHTATLLATGPVLVAGGRVGLGQNAHPIASAEVGR